MGCIKSKTLSKPDPEVEGATKRPKHGRFREKEVPNGSLINVYKQDPTVKGIGYRLMWLPLQVRPGPSTKDIVISGLSTIVTPSDTDNNYLFNPISQPQEFDAAHTLAVVNHVLTMYRRGLTRMNTKKTLHWQWGEQPIRVFPVAGEQANAFYSRKHRALTFYYFRHETNQNIIYTARSFDVVAHETGHAILDSLKPRYIESDRPQTRALHESFGDLTAIFALLDQLDLCDAIIVQSKGNLHQKSFFVSFAEEFGEGLGRNFGLRNADANLAMDEVTNEVHDLSRVFTGAVYDIMVEYYEITRDLNKYDPAETLYRVGKHFCAVIISAFLAAPETNADFVDVMEAMVQVETNDQAKSIIRRHFEKRKVFVNSDAQPKRSERSLFIASCGTIQVQYNLELKDVIKATCQPGSPSQDNLIANVRL